MFRIVPTWVIASLILAAGGVQAQSGANPCVTDPAGLDCRLCRVEKRCPETSTKPLPPSASDPTLSEVTERLKTCPQRDADLQDAVSKLGSVMTRYREVLNSAEQFRQNSMTYAFNCDSDLPRLRQEEEKLNNLSTEKVAEVLEIAKKCVDEKLQPLRDRASKSDSITPIYLKRVTDLGRLESIDIPGLTEDLAKFKPPVEGMRKTFESYRRDCQG